MNMKELGELLKAARLQKDVSWTRRLLQPVFAVNGSEPSKTAISRIPRSGLRHRHAAKLRDLSRPQPG